MKRDRHKIELKNRVLKVAGKLFVQQGYSKTTIKQIIKEAHITTGSLYHFFKNKEDILMHISRDVFAVAAGMSDGFIRNDDDPGLRFSLEIAMQLYCMLHYEKIAEIYHAAYNSWHISELIVRLGSIRNEELFKGYNPDFTKDDYHARTLAIKGIFHSFADELVNAGRNVDDERIYVIVEMMLLIFNVSPDQVKKIIKKTRRIISINTSSSKKTSALIHSELISSDSLRAVLDTFLHE
jgi:AcrR family transcriptional regulator